MAQVRRPTTTKEIKHSHARPKEWHARNPLNSEGSGQSACRGAPAPAKIDERILVGDKFYAVNLLTSRSSPPTQFVKPRFARFSRPI